MYGTNESSPYESGPEPYWPALASTSRPRAAVSTPPPFPTRSTDELPAFITPAIDPSVRTAGFATLVTALIVAFGTLTKSWFVDADGGVGLVGLEACRQGMCTSTSWFDVPFVPSQIPILATTALLACAGTIVLMLHAGFMLLQGTPERVQLGLLGHAFAVALVGVIAFVVSLTLGTWTHGLALGWSTVVSIAGLFAAGITIAFVVRPVVRDAR